jgi:uncharacterized protein
MGEANFLQWARGKDVFMRSPRSPLPSQWRSNFSGLRYHPYNASLEFQTELVPDPDRQLLVLPTSNGSEVVYERVGWFAAVIAGQTVRLAGFAREGEAQPESLFVPFKDASSGLETYGGGRYLDVPLHDRLPNQNLLEVNFNFAYNPYCAYSEGWSCPIPPHENWLAVPILAGELKFEPDANAINDVEYK